ncbi:MAG: Na(+)-translocating NADH-quinone reductase subunit C [Bdellovibrionaceae bacterium]|nr:Na(+)-translocating NADH-quinone reductase subunit C [Pseudobdellovibrionaceae bacterium]
MDNEAIKTLVVATILCVVCSVLVSGAAVLLKPMQDINKELDVKKNLLLASGLIHEPVTKAEIEEAYTQIKAEVIDLATGEVTDINPETFDQAKATKDPEMGMFIPAEKDVSGIKTRSKFAPVYKYIKDDQVEMVVLPVYGKGLWSTMYGFLALSSDAQTIKGLGFYSHGETPGLGGEIDNPKWKELWIGKKVFDNNFNVEVKVVKGAVSESTPQADYKVDGLSGATITSNGVTNMLRYWLGPDGFGPFLKKLSTGADHSEHKEESASMEEGA